MRIIEASYDDISTIQSLSDIIWPHTYKELLTPQQIAYMMDMMYSTSAIEKQLEEGHHYLFAEQDGEYLGYVSYELNYNKTDLTKIHKIYILPSLQGKGVGSFFINAVGEIAKKNGNNELSLNVNRFNKAVNFYKHMGFEIVATEDNDIGNGFLMEDHVMNKKLS